MNAMEFLKEKHRLTNYCDIECMDCRLHKHNNPMGIACDDLENEYPNMYISIVEQWSKDCPKQTYLSTLLKAFPNTPLHADGAPKCCITVIGFDKKECKRPNGTCKDCWNSEIKLDNN